MSSSLEAAAAAAIRENLGLEDFKGDQLFEGAIDADELAAAVIEALALTKERRWPSSWNHPHPGPDTRWVSPWVAVDGSRP